MKASTRVAAVATLCLAAAACVRLNTPEKKAGYAVGHQIGQSLERIKDKVDVDQLAQGLEDQAAGKGTLADADRTQLLIMLQQGKAADAAKTGYAVGETIAKNLQDSLQFVDVSLVERGIRDELAGKTLLSDADVQAALQDLDQRRSSVLGAKNKADGDAFLAKNKAVPGVKVTASGLQYQVLREGTGRRPKATDTVNVDYVGTLINGTKFDSSYDRHQPAVFELDRVIPGWTEGLQLMRVGSKYRFVIPSNLGYGERGAGGTIGPDSVLVFEVELHGIEKAGRH